MTWDQHNQAKKQNIIDLIEEGLPQHLVEKKSGMSTKTFSKFLSEIVLENLDVIQRWKPLFDLQPLEKFPKSIQQRLLKCRRNPNAECFVRIDWNDDDGSLRLSLYEMEIMNKACLQIWLMSPIWVSCIRSKISIEQSRTARNFLKI